MFIYVIENRFWKFHGEVVSPVKWKVQRKRVFTNRQLKPTDLTQMNYYEWIATKCDRQITIGIEPNIIKGKHLKKDNNMLLS